MKLRLSQSHTLDVYLAEANTLAVKKLLKKHSKTTAKVINRKLNSLLTHILVSLFEPREATLQLLQLMGSRLAFYFH